MVRYEYPTHHPEILYNVPVEQMKWLFGIALVTVLPPRKLLFPVLPYRTDKLLFPLCRTCADLRQSEPCHHSEEERQLEGTYTTVEIRKAMEMGYRLKEIHQVYNFPTRSRKLFSDYMKTFLKLKYEASGWGKGERELTDEEKEEKLERILRCDGIELDREKIAGNPGMRTVSKLALNSLWGRLAMQEQKMQTRYFFDPVEFEQTLIDPKIEIRTINV